MTTPRAQAGEFLADAYGKRLGRVISPTDLVEYPQCILALLSDAQEASQNFIINRARTTNMVNGAKVMLGRMMDAGRTVERAA